MSQFTDAKQRPWTLNVTTGTIKKARSELKLDLADPTQATMDRLADDPVLLVDLLWLVCAEQAKERGVSPEDFGGALVGDPIDAAVSALLEAVSDFFPRQKRLLLREANAKAATVRQKATDLALAKLNDPELEAKITEAMKTRLETEIQQVLTRLSSPTNLPAKSAESTPT
jgi:hypothetical protein